MLTTEQEAQKYFYHSMLRSMGYDRCHHRPPMNRNEQLIAQDNAREQEKRTYGPNDALVMKGIEKYAIPHCELCGSTDNLREKHAIYDKLCYNEGKIIFYRCPDCRGL